VQHLPGCGRDASCNSDLLAQDLLPLPVQGEILGNKVIIFVVAVDWGKENERLEL